MRLHRIGGVVQPLVDDVDEGDPGRLRQQAGNNHQEQSGGAGEKGECVTLAGKALGPDLGVDGVAERGQGNDGQADDKEVLDVHRGYVIRVVPVDNSLIYNDIIRFDRPD